MPSFPFPLKYSSPMNKRNICLRKSSASSSLPPWVSLAPRCHFLYDFSQTSPGQVGHLPHLLLLLTSILFVCQELFASLSSGPAVGGCQSEGVGSILNQVSNNHYSSPGRMPWSLRGSRVEWQSRKYMPN